MDIISAFAEGKTIQYKADTGSWQDLTENEGLPMGILAEEPNNFRVKPDSEYRPFANAEECWQEMLKHNPFGWVKGCDGSKFTIETIASSDSGIFVNDEEAFYFSEMFEKFTFTDGTPFGVKIEN